MPVTTNQQTKEQQVTKKFIICTNDHPEADSIAFANRRRLVMSPKEQDRNDIQETKKNRLLQLKKDILIEKAYVDIKPYSHNLICCYLRSIDEEFGKEVVNDVIVSMGLQELGWNVV
jgi:hypothetical protein